MNKTAQKRSLLNKLREMTNISGKATEKFFNPEFKELMDNLRDKTDDPVRAIVSGETIGNASAPNDGISLKELLKSVKSNINRREYMTAVAALSRFHRKMYDVVDLLKNFNSNVDKVHEKFLFEGLDEDNKRYLHDLKQRLNAHNAASNSAFIKEANILDFFTNIATERGRALAAWEKRYPKQLGKLKKDTDTMLQQSERLLSITLSTLKEMATARATRNPDNYIKAADKIIKDFDGYDKKFRDYYKDNVKGFLEKQEFVKPPAPAQVTPDIDKTQLGGGPILPAPPDLSTTIKDPVSIDADTIKMNVLPKTPTLIPGGILPPVPVVMAPRTSTSVPVILPPPTDSNLKDTLPSGSEPLTIKNTAAHASFFNSLKAMSNESPELLAAHIIRYAKSIQTSNLETSIKLFKLAKSIKE